MRIRVWHFGAQRDVHCRAIYDSLLVGRHHFIRSSNATHTKKKAYSVLSPPISHSSSSSSSCRHTSFI